MSTKRIYNLDSFYVIINDHIETVYSFTAIKNIQSIIKMCRLKPKDMILGKNAKERSKKLKLVKWWIDEFGNSFKIIKNKRIKIIFNDTELINKKIRCTDLYYCLPIDKIVKISKLLYLVIGKDAENNQCVIIGFLGLDNYLRVYNLTDGRWKQISPLQLSMKILKQIIKNNDIKYYKICDVGGKVMSNLKDQKSWFSHLPPRNDFLEEIKEYKFILDILKKENNVKR